MGGYGSGRWRNHIKRRLVDDAIRIDCDDLIRSVSVTPWGSGRIVIRPASGQSLGSVPFHVIPVEQGRLILAFSISVAGESARQTIPLAGPVAFAGRTAFECPISAQDDLSHCAARCRRLYLPPGERFFGCRACHKLSYRTCQSRDPRIERLRRNPDMLDELTARVLAEARTGRPKMSVLVRLMRALNLAIQDEIAALRRST